MTNCAPCGLFRLLKGWAATAKSAICTANLDAPVNGSANEDIEMTNTVKRSFVRGALGGTALLALTACGDGFDLDLRGGLGNRFDTTDAAAKATQDRPQPDARGVITYSNYQVAIAQGGETVADVAARIGTDATELARYNGLKPDTQLRPNEVLALRSPVASLPGGAAGAPGSVDISALAQGAIDASPVTATALPAASAAGPEPVRHQVARGETAFTIARLYSVSVRALADWNGLDQNFAVREGQFLMIPVAQQPASATTAARSAAPLAATTTLPGTGTPTPTPPSATQPLPQEKPKPIAAPVETPPAPKLAPVKPASSAQMEYPVQGAIVREYAKGKNDGIGISASAGTAVKAAASGTVAAITENTDNLPIIVVKHPDNLLTVYANVDGLKVKKGDSVSRGQQIANVRSGGSDFLHFEVRKGFDSVDPLPYLQ